MTIKDEENEPKASVSRNAMIATNIALRIKIGIEEKDEPNLARLVLLLSDSFDYCARKANQVVFFKKMQQNFRQINPVGCKDGWCRVAFLIGRD